LGSTNVLL